MFEDKLSKWDLFPIITGIFCVCLIISNILASKTFIINNIVLPSAIIIFPIVYLINDILTEIYGFNLAKRVIFLGFFMNLVAVISYQITILLPGTDPIVSNAFNIVLGSTPRILIASLVSYLTGSYINAYLMKLMKSKWDNYLFARCFLSTLFGESLDSIIFITIAFVGTIPTIELITMIICQAIFKISYEVIVYPLTKYVINWMNTLKNDLPLELKS